MTLDSAEYNRNKYWDNAEYRKKRIGYSTKWNKNNREKVNLAQRNRLANRTPQQIKKRNQHIKKMRDLGRWKR